MKESKYKLSNLLPFIILGITKPQQSIMLERMMLIISNLSTKKTTHPQKR